MLKEKCDVCGSTKDVRTFGVFEFCNPCLTKWKNFRIKTIIDDLKTGNLQITSYECICGNTIINLDDCNICGNPNLFKLTKFGLILEDLKYIFRKYLGYKRVESEVTDIILNRVFGLQLKIEGSRSQLREAIMPENNEIIFTKTCNWQLLSTLFEYFYPDVIPKRQGNHKIEKHIKEIYHTERITNEDIVRIISEYEDLNPRKIIISKHGNKKLAINGDKVITSGYGNKKLILSYLRSKMWDYPTDQSERKSAERG